jgi:SAM-dependent methyltransferase
MLLQKSLGLKKEQAYLIEDSFEGLEMNLKTLNYLNDLMQLPEGSIEEAIIIDDKNGNCPGIAIKNKYEDSDFWFAIPYPFNETMKKQTEKLFKDILNSGKIKAIKNKKIDEEKFRGAIREYLSIGLVEGAFCDCDKEKDPASYVLNKDRNSRIKSFLIPLSKKYGYILDEMDVLEICCGNGMSTAAITPIFNSIISVDNDRCAVCNGIYHGTLEPASTMVADAMELSRYINKKYDAILGFMLGAIYEFNKPVWRSILKESVKLAKDGGFILLTVNQKDEIEFLSGSLKSLGVTGEILDNRNDVDIYDGWVYFAVIDANKVKV